MDIKPGDTDARLFDAAEHLTDDQDYVYFLEDGLETDTVEEMSSALDSVIRAKGLASLAQHMGISRDELNDILNPYGGPKRDELMKIYIALGVDPAKKSDAAE